jgi:hypothetical protein
MASKTYVDDEDVWYIVMQKTTSVKIAIESVPGNSMLRRITNKMPVPPVNNRMGILSVFTQITLEISEPAKRILRKLACPEYSCLLKTFDACIRKCHFKLVFHMPGSYLSSSTVPTDLIPGLHTPRTNPSTTTITSTTLTREFL